MNRFIPVFFACLALLVLPARAGTPNCDALDNPRAGSIDFDQDLEFLQGDMVFRKDGREVMIITGDRELYIDGERIELDAESQELVDGYYRAVEVLVDDALDLAGDAAGFGISAAIEALTAVFHGEREIQAMEKRIEARGREIEAQADSMCERFRHVESIERELHASLPAFEPVLFPEAASR